MASGLPVLGQQTTDSAIFCPGLLGRLPKASDREAFL